MMKIGTVLNIEKHTGKKIHKYHCKVIELTMDGVIIDYPIDVKTRKTSFLSKGTSLKVVYSDEQQNIYQFLSIVTGKVKMNIPALSIKKPEPEEIIRIQRREYVRVDAAVDIAVHSPDNSFPPFATVTADISGGGMAVLAPKDRQLEVGKMADVYLPIIRNNLYTYISGQAEVVLIREANNRMNLISLKFDSISAKDRQAIVHFCFEKQREARKKELS